MTDMDNSSMQYLGRCAILTTFLLTVMAISSAVYAAPVATLLRVTLNNQPVNAALSSSYGVETTLQEELQNQAHTTIDLTPLHADFQKLRYTHDCPVVDGAFSYDDCAKFGNYAEAVIEVLDNVRQGVDADVQSITPLKQGGYVLIGEIQSVKTERNITGTFHFRVHSFCDGSVPVARKVNHDVRIGPKNEAFTLNEFYSDLVYRAVKDFHNDLRSKGLAC